MSIFTSMPRVHLQLYSSTHTIKHFGWSKKNSFHLNDKICQDMEILQITYSYSKALWG